MSITEQNLEWETHDYWQNIDSNSPVVGITDYICRKKEELDGKSLLQAELDWAKEKIKGLPCETLVLLIGYSFEPLMQSVCVYKPQKILLILNEEGYLKEEKEEWPVFSRHVKELVEKLYECGLIKNMPEFLGPEGLGYATSGEPIGVFRKLLEALHEEKDVVIDVTGGKKSMVSGAFMYAAYSGMRISYVDFDKYDPKLRRPYGYTCKIGELSNPYEEFALRNWEGIRDSYENYQFDEAIRLLKKVVNIMQRTIPESRESINQLEAYFRYYAQWDRGDYRDAKQLARTLEIAEEEQPAAVVELGDKWYQIDHGEFIYKNCAKDFFVDPRIVHVYVCDEVERIDRLIKFNEDYRSAFVRAGGVNEILMLARIVSLISDPGDRQKFLEPLNEKTPKIYDIFKSLTDSCKQFVKVKNDINFKNAPDITIPKLANMHSWWRKTKIFNGQKGWDYFLTIRNELMHKYFSVPREWAEDALTFVKANFEDYLGHPIGDLQICTKALPWSRLCEICGVSKFLPTNLRKDRGSYV